MRARANRARVLCAAAAAWLAASSGYAQDAASAAPASADGSNAARQDGHGMLARELQALSDAHLLSLKDASESELRALVAKGEQLHLSGRDDEAVVVLLG